MKNLSRQMPLGFFIDYKTVKFILFPGGKHGLYKQSNRLPRDIDIVCTLEQKY